MLMNQAVQASAVELLTSIGSNSVGAVVTDPPFFVNVGRADGWDKACGMGADPWEDISSVEEAIRWTQPHADQIKRILRPGGSAVIMGGSQSLAAWEVAAAKAGLNWMAEITVLWNTGKPRARNFGSLSTAIRWYSKPGARHAFNAGDVRSIYSNVLVARKVPIAQRAHPAQKPVELTNFLVSLLSNDGDLIVDPFCGAGSTAVSAAICGRRWIAGDLEEKYVRVTEQRVRHAEMEEMQPLFLWVNNKLVPVAA